MRTETPRIVTSITAFVFRSPQSAINVGCQPARIKAFSIASVCLFPAFNENTYREPLEKKRTFLSSLQYDFSHKESNNNQSGRISIS